MRPLRTIIFLASVLCAMSPVIAAPASERSEFSGIWFTQQRDGAFEIKPCGDRLCGYIYAIFRVPDPALPLLDNRNEHPELHSRALCRLQVIGDLKKLSPDKWGGGWVYDPNVGKTYGADLTLQSRDKLLVYGHLMLSFIGRKVLWIRAGVGLPRCSPPKA